MHQRASSPTHRLHMRLCKSLLRTAPRCKQSEPLDVGTRPHLPVVVERRVNWTVSAMIFVFSRNGHELLVRMLLLGRIIRLTFLEVRSKPYDAVSDTLHNYDQDALTFPSPTLVSQRLPRVRDQLFATKSLRKMYRLTKLRNLPYSLSHTSNN